uniref:Uncharacterized protein n=1 Tax=Arundo donax TaxID=35708 RepID=A0A0A9AJB6_ARUDO
MVAHDVNGGGVPVVGVARERAPWHRMAAARLMAASARPVAQRGGGATRHGGGQRWRPWRWRSNG